MSTNEVTEQDREDAYHAAHPGCEECEEGGCIVDRCTCYAGCGLTPLVKHAPSGTWMHASCAAKVDAAAAKLGAKAACERLRLELLVSQVRGQLLAKSIPMTSGADLYAWATDRARNILAGLQGETI